MPTEDVLNRNFEDLFSAQVRYEVPFFQRGYAWENTQWKKMLEDVQNYVMDELDDSDFEEQELFFGPVVVQEKTKAPHPNLKRYLIIDGQQRITTVYLMLAMIRKALDQRSHQSTEAEKRSVEIWNLLCNKVEGADDYLKLKVFSAKGDRLPTYYCVFNENPQSPYLAADMQLYMPDHNHVDKLVKFFTKHIRHMDAPLLILLSKALTRSLKIVWIPLDEQKDDAQAIFESLNDSGMPLSAAELMCNYLFRPLMNDNSVDHEKLHNEKWLKAQRTVEEPHFQDYLENMFSIGEKKKVGQGRKLYVHFKVRHRKLDKGTALSVLEQIMDYAPMYNYCTRPVTFKHPEPSVHRLLLHISATNMGVITPFLMALLMAHNKERITTSELTDVLRETYVLLVRRKITNLRVTKYTIFFPSLLNLIANEPNKVKAFHKEVQREGLWISNEEFEDAFLNKELYNPRELNFTRHVLEHIDRSMERHGELPDYTTIDTVEHVLPQKLDDRWRDALGDEADHLDLKRILNTIGNLSLNSRAANSSHGQKLFEEKQENYNTSSALANDLKNRQGPWNMAAVKQRSADLAKHALEVWKWNL